MLRSLFSAFLMYSRIPMPHTEWKEENRRYSLGFFPLVGAVIGGLLVLWRYLSALSGNGQLLFATVAVILPVLVTGGIHLDGFCDVEDAMASCSSPDKRLEIMKDPHIGSFAAIRLGMLLVAQFGLMSQITGLRSACTVGCVHVLSRAISGIAAVTMKSARNNGSLQSFVSPAHRNTVIAMDLSFAAAACAGMIIAGGYSGAAAVAAAVITAAYFRHFAYKSFGGVTGDLCGWLLQLCELWSLAAVVFTDTVLEAII